jgi:hypothetical protein
MYSPLFLSSGEARPFNPCTLYKLICQNGTRGGCTAHCTALQTTDVYRQARTITGITCGAVQANSSSLITLDSCSKCGTDTCLIATTAPCYAPQFGTYLSSYSGYLPACPSDASGRPLQLTDVTGNCTCFCGEGYELRNGSCSAIGCNPQCQNLGDCQRSTALVNGTETETFRCRCFGGWTGKSCTSRCFFPVSANVTSCDDGLYQIIGGVTLPGNRTVDLYKEVPDLRELQINGTLRFSSNNITLSIVNTNITLSRTIVINGDWVQGNGSTLRSSIDLLSGDVFGTTKIDIFGTADFSGARLEILLNSTQLLQRLLNSNGGSLSINMLSYESLGGSFGEITLLDVGQSSDGCTKVKSTPEYSTTSGGRGSLALLITLDKSTCLYPSTVPKDGQTAVTNLDGTQVGTIVAAVVTPVVAIAIAVSVAVWQRAKLNKAMEAAKEKLFRAQKAETQQKMKKIPSSSSSSPPSSNRTSASWQKAQPNSQI